MFFEGIVAHPHTESKSSENLIIGLCSRTCDFYITSTIIFTSCLHSPDDPITHIGSRGILESKKTNCSHDTDRNGDVSQKIYHKKKLEYYALPPPHQPHQPHQPHHPPHTCGGGSSSPLQVMPSPHGVGLKFTMTVGGALCHTSCGPEKVIRSPAA